MEEEKRFILDMLAKGKITTGEALQLIQALPTEEDTGQALEAGPVELIPPGVSTSGDIQVLDPDWAGRSPHSPLPADAEKWRRWWQIPLWLGVGVTVTGALLLSWILAIAGLGFLFVCASLPFWIGVALTALAWGSRTARWIHIRVDQRPGEWPRRIALSFPLPLGLAAWILRSFGRWIPGLESTSVDEILTALSTSTSSENPLFIDVQDGEDGEHVQVFIG